MPPRLPEAERRALGAAAEAICARVAEAFGVRGVFGVDMVLGRRAGVGGGGQPAAAGVAGDAERPTRSRRTSRARGRLPRPPTAGAAGKAVVFAREDVVMPDTSAWDARDIPHPGERIAAGRPICTLVATGATPESVLAELEARAAAEVPVVSPCAWAALATCGGCGLVCDDIELAGERVWSAPARSATPGSPSGSVRHRRRARVDGREVGLDAALDAAAAILREARAPLVYGLGRTTCEAQRAAVALAEGIGGTIAPAGASGFAVRRRAGASTATLGDVRDRAEIVVIWRADPVLTHPRLLERLRLPGRGRELVVVDELRTRDRGGGGHVHRDRGRARGAVASAGARPRVADATRRPVARRSARSRRGCGPRQRRDPARVRGVRRRRSSCTRSCATCAATRTPSR